MSAKRPDELARDFRSAFGRSPDVIIRSPGRGNLIGEHTDYSLLPVLPIAIDRKTLVAVAATDSGTVVARSRVFPGEARIERGAGLARAAGANAAVGTGAGA